MTRGPATPEQAEAVEARVLYQDRVCGYGGPPPAAEASFTKSAATMPYCTAVAAQHEAIGKAGRDAEALRAYVTSESFSTGLEAQNAAAPPEIADDVETANDWVSTRKLEVFEKFDYDVRRVLLESSADELAAWTMWHPDIVEQDSRVTAYLEQACGA